MSTGPDRDVNEFLDELEADPDYQRRRAELDSEHERIVNINRADAAPLAKELHRRGFWVDFPDDLYGQDFDYRAAIPVLIDWLPRMENLDVKCGIVRALSVKWARPAAAKQLAEEYRRALDETSSQYEMLRSDIANALDLVADPSVVDDLMSFVTDDRSTDDARAMLLQALGNTRSATAALFVTDRLADEANPQVLMGGLVALRRLRDPSVRHAVDRLASHVDRGIQREAVRTAKALDRAEHLRPAAE